MSGYLRFLTTLSLLAIIALAVAAGIFFRDRLADDFSHATEQNNANLAQGYINAVWKRYDSVMVPLISTPSKLKGNPDVAAFAGDTIRYFKDMPLVRVNIYTASGALLFPASINSVKKLAGDAASPDSNLVINQLQRGTAASKLLPNITLQNGSVAVLIQTVTPLHGDNSKAVEGAIEIIYDTTEAWMELQTIQFLVVAGIAGFCLLFMLILFAIYKRTETIIAKQHESNLELAAAAATAEAESREKSQFLANVSHELRTPLNAIIGFSDIIKKEVMDQVQDQKHRDYINDIHNSGVHLLSLINDILDYSKAEAGKLEVEVTEVSAAKMIQNCTRLLAPRAESAKVRIVEDLPQDQLIMSTDSKKFKQILLNLLSNAVKFTPSEGEVRITAWRGPSDDIYFFEVRDSGIGIAPKDISRAMAPFGQVDSALSRKYEGTGLGLPLTRKFVELMGGTFTIASKANSGTTITFTLPRELKPREGIIIKEAA